MSGQNNYAQPSAQAAQAVGLLQQVRQNLISCHEMLNNLHQFADQFVGESKVEQGANKAPEPNGHAEELRDSSGHLLIRLNMLCQRLAVL